MDCSADLLALSREAETLAGRAMASVTDPGFNGVATVGYSLAGAAMAIGLRQRATELAALARTVRTAAIDLAADQRSWDRRDAAERAARAAKENAERDRRSAAEGSYPL